MDLGGSIVCPPSDETIDFSVATTGPCRKGGEEDHSSGRLCQVGKPTLRGPSAHLQTIWSAFRRLRTSPSPKKYQAPVIIWEQHQQKRSQNSKVFCFFGRSGRLFRQPAMTEWSAQNICDRPGQQTTTKKKNETCPEGNELICTSSGSAGNGGSKS